MEKKTKGLTPKELSKATGAPFYVIEYLRRLNRLPILFETTGKGDVTIFKLDAVAVVKNHIDRKK